MPYFDGYTGLFYACYAAKIDFIHRILNTFYAFFAVNMSDNHRKNRPHCFTQIVLESILELIINEVLSSTIGPSKVTLYSFPEVSNFKRPTYFSSRKEMPDVIK